MPTTTEILLCPLSAGSDIGDEQNEAAKVLKEVGETLKSTDGMQKIQFGTTVENPEVFQLLVDWDTLSHHKTFMATEAYQPFLKRFLSIAGGAPTMLHADLEPASEYRRATGAPVTEMATFYFGSKEAPSDYLEGVHKFRDVFAKEKPAGYLGAVVGLTHEDDLKSPKEGLEGRAAVLAIGWESVEAHMKVRESQIFKDNIHLLRNGVKEAEVHHVQLLNFVE